MRGCVPCVADDPSLVFDDLDLFHVVGRGGRHVPDADAVDAVALVGGRHAFPGKHVSKVSVARGAHDLCRDRRSGRRTVRWERGVGKRHARRR